VIWGLLNGLYQVAGIITRPFTDKVKAVLKITGTSMTYGFLKRLENFALISFTWAFFRANNLGELKLILTKLFTWNMSFFANFNTASLGMDRFDLVISVLFIALLMIYELLQEKVDIGGLFRKEPLVFRWAVYLTVITIIILFGVYGNANTTQFIYFKF
jgi:hypothetical protein